MSTEIYSVKYNDTRTGRRNKIMPKIIDHKQFRGKLLEGSFKLFSQKGYANVTIRSIARELGVSTGSLYHYFKNKEDILEQMFAYIRQRNFGGYLSRIDGIDDLDERLRLITDYWKDHMNEYQDLMLLAIDYHRHHGRSKRARKIFNDFATYYIYVLSETFQITHEAAETFCTYLIGMVWTSLLAPDIFNLNDHINFLTGYIVEAMKSTDSRPGLHHVKRSA